ncbi:hypothetical protein AB1Y20_020839 [Prymnesium parvum]|uniref:Secreted protein n=1 Tax=Prymnesium parvum TaxID=97485 RepID=A0AB34JYD9_PRYPA
MRRACAVWRAAAVEAHLSFYLLSTSLAHAFRAAYRRWRVACAKAVPRLYLPHPSASLPHASSLGGAASVWREQKAATPPAVRCPS